MAKGQLRLERAVSMADVTISNRDLLELPEEFQSQLHYRIVRPAQFLKMLDL
jgi:hypothetical protein